MTTNTEVLDFRIFTNEYYGPHMTTNTEDHSDEIEKALAKPVWDVNDAKLPPKPDDNELLPDSMWKQTSQDIERIKERVEKLAANVSAQFNDCTFMIRKHDDRLAETNQHITNLKKEFKEGCVKTNFRITRVDDRVDEHVQKLEKFNRSLSRQISNLETASGSEEDLRALMEVAIAETNKRITEVNKGFFELDEFQKELRKQISNLETHVLGPPETPPDKREQWINNTQEEFNRKLNAQLEKARLFVDDAKGFNREVDASQTRERDKMVEDARYCLDMIDVIVSEEITSDVKRDLVRWCYSKLHDTLTELA